MIDAAIGRIVRQRAGDRCEYCRLQQAHYPLWRHQIEHIVPKKHFGSDQLGNLSLACVRCNLSKSSNLTGIDPLTDEIVALFHPRIDRWEQHFHFEKAIIEGYHANRSSHHLGPE